VPTGPHDADELREPDADVVLTGLVEFAAWLVTYTG